MPWMKRPHHSDNRVPMLQNVFCTYCLCAHCSAQVCASLSASCNSQCTNIFRVLFLNLKIATLQPELRERTTRATFDLESCDFAAGMRERASRTTFVHKSSDIAAGASRSCGDVLRALLLYLKVETLQGACFAHYFCT